MEVPLQLRLDRHTGRDLRLQIYEQIKAQIESGLVSAGYRLPPSRDLANSLSVARKTVAEAYQQLLTEGFLRTRGKGGTFVKELGQTNSNKVPEQTSLQLLGNLSQYGQSIRMLKLTKAEAPANIEVSLFSINPNIEYAGTTDWFDKALARKRRQANVGLSSPMGYPELRRAICDYVASTRGINCAEEEVAIFSGFPEMIDLIVRLHVARGDKVVVEDPCFPVMRESAFAYGADIQPVTVDDSGLQVQNLPENSKSSPCKMIFLTPAHQFPCGSVLSAERRYALLDWASKAGTVVLEDDYDSDFFFKGFPPPALKSLPQSERVIYISSFKKLVPPGFSVDFAILPKPFVELYRQAMKLSVTPHPTRAQAALAEFITSGEILRQSKRIKAIYAARHHKVSQSLKRHFGPGAKLSATSFGLHVLVQVNSKISDSEIVRRALDAGVELETTQDFYCRSPVKGEFIIGYGSLEDELIDEAIRRFAEAAAIAR